MKNQYYVAIIKRGGSLNKGGTKLNRENLLAPSTYNLVQEFEKYATDENRLALIWKSEKDETKKLHTKN